MAELYLEQIHIVMELAQVLSEKLQTLDAVVHQFGGTLQHLEQQVPPSGSILTLRRMETV